ncbi:hypothetical protein FB45DRAFT_908982 [Roridomyces roridus]|uniref:NAD(P)-binding protein n=1 Tax=Roridomyces roridus TaxID=1738132 RepID=A0AAD7BYJ3_9AGAR|nr:hypothetical protein FB45DRAFT_908982 [Roridomyces roridus]
MTTTPTLAVAEAANAIFSTNYIPVAVFVGGTSGVGQAMAEAFARQTKGFAHIIIIGRSAAAAERILADFPKPGPLKTSSGWAHEFVQCDATSIKSVRVACGALRARLGRINFLVISAGGPMANSMVLSQQIPEGLDESLAMRYFMRYTFLKELVPLLESARKEGQHAHFMTIQGAGFGASIPTQDLGLQEAKKHAWNFTKGMTPVGSLFFAYNDGLVAYFAAEHPNIAFTHISPGQVRTVGGAISTMGWLFAPLKWLFNTLKAIMGTSQDESAQYMLYALLDSSAERGVFFRGSRGQVISSHVSDVDHKGWEDFALPTAHKAGVFNGFTLKGYGGSDATVSGLIHYTEKVLGDIE